MNGEDHFPRNNKPHQARHSGKKFEKKKNKEKTNQDNVDPKIKNPKAFAINGVVRAERRFRRTQDIETKKERIPTVDRTPVEPPPFIIAIVGPPKVGKSTLFRNLIKNFTRQTLSEIKGPVTIVSGKKRRLTLLECNNDLNSMIDVAKIADLVLLLIDASFGFEMEIFEFLNICQVHGFPQIMGVLTHLDTFKNKTQLKKTKKALKHRFWTEVYPGSKLFYLSGYYPNTDAYPKNEIHNLSRFVSVMKFRPTQWRSDHAHVLVDRMEDLTSLEAIRVNPKVDRTVSLYGFVHGTFLKTHVSVHIPGLGDYTPQQITSLSDPCPLPKKERHFKRSLDEKDKVMYAPFCGVGGIVYDQDAVYIDLGGSHSHRKHADSNQTGEIREPAQDPMVEELRELSTTLDAKIESAGLKIFSNSAEIKLADMDVPKDNMDQSDDEGEEYETLEDDEAENITEEAEQTEESSLPKSRNFEVVQSEDGRVRRKVVFENGERVSDDVTEEIQAEINNLKASMNENDNAAEDSEDDDEEEMDFEDGNESDDDENEAFEIESTSTPGANASTVSVQKKDANDASKPAQDSSVVVSEDSSPAKIKKSKHQKAVSFKPVSKSIEGPEQASGEEELEVKEESFSEDEQDDSDKGDQLEMMDEGSSSDDDEQSDEEHEDENKELKANPGDLDDGPSEKDERIAKAEAAFYSRFRSRSLQKMIYDPIEDYLNVTSRADFDNANVAVRDDRGVVSSDELKDLFIGGDYADTAKRILQADGDDSNDDDVFGDFEMMDEDEDGLDNRESTGKKPSNETERQELKKKLKEKFDMEYDDGKNDKSYYKEWKSAMEEQSKSNRQFFEEIEDPKFLEDLRGFAPGTYVRVEIDRIPCEFITKFEPQLRCPLIVGSLDTANQETLAVVQARVKKHRWHPKILKSRDPIVMSIGWRRFQTIAFYSVHDHNMRNRMIKYTPEHLHCIANFYGPMTPQGTGILGIAPSGFDGFRVTLTGTIIDMDKSTELVKKLKLVGSPSQVFKKSAFVQGMFNSRLEVAKFVGAKIKTVSGIRGVIKRPLQAPPGAFRATFEDKILMSDIVFCRTWVTVDIPKFFLSIANHVDAKSRLMKTLGELKREKGIQVEPNSNNLYTDIVREDRTFKPLKVPKSLQAKLPYKEKPKVLAKENAPKRIAVIKEPNERKMTKFFNVLKSRLSEKEQREKLDKAKKHADHTKKLQKSEEKISKRQKELKKKVFKTLEKLNKHKGNGSDNRNFNSKRGKQFKIGRR